MTKLENAYGSKIASIIEKAENINLLESLEEPFIDRITEKGNYDFTINTHGDTLPYYHRSFSKNNPVTYCHFPSARYHIDSENLEYLRDIRVTGFRQIDEMDYSEKNVARIFDLETGQKIKRYFKFLRDRYENLMKNTLVLTNSGYTRKAISDAFNIDAKILYPPVDVGTFHEIALKSNQRDGMVLVISRNYIPNRWYKQKHFVVIVTEKSALFEDFLTIIEQEDLQVMLYALGGYYGTTDMSDLYDILVYHQKKLGQYVHLVFFGDYDGHGLVIEKNMIDKLERIGNCYLSEGKGHWHLWMHPDLDPKTLKPLPPEQQSFTFERLAVTLPQISKHRLQVLNERSFKSKEDVIRFYTKGKKKDFAKKDFALAHKKGDNYTYFEVEVDGIVSSRWEVVKRLLVDNVLKYWDEQIYNSVKDELTVDRVKEQLAARVSLLKEEDKERVFAEDEEEEEE